MAQEQTEIHLTKIIQAPISQVFQSFINAANLIEWLCDDLKLVKMKGNNAPDYFYFWWMDGYYANGMFKQIKKNNLLQFTWQGNKEPVATEVTITFIESNTGVTVNLVHSGLGVGEGWAEISEDFKQGWDVALENLKYSLENGLDLRHQNRPMIGIYVGDVIAAETAAEKDLPVDYGIRISGVVSGMGAEKLGMKENDILCQLDGKDLKDFPDIYNIANQHQPGDSVSLVYYRGSERKEGVLQFSRQPEPKYKPTALGLSEQVRQYHQKINEKIEKILEDVSDSEAEFIPAAGEWCIKEVLAHLIAEERSSYLHAVSWSVRNLNYFYPATNPQYLKSIVRNFPTIPDLLEELKRVQKEKSIFLSELPMEFVERKPSYIRLAGNMPEDMLHHYKEHLRQLSELVSAARGE